MACSNAHAMPRRHCTSPGFNLARTTLRWVASRRCQTETRSSAGSAARNPHTRAAHLPQMPVVERSPGQPHPGRLVTPRLEPSWVGGQARQRHADQPVPAARFRAAQVQGPDDPQFTVSRIHAWCMPNRAVLPHGTVWFGRRSVLGRQFIRDVLRGRPGTPRRVAGLPGPAAMVLSGVRTLVRVAVLLVDQRVLDFRKLDCCCHERARSLATTSWSTGSVGYRTGSGLARACVYNGHPVHDPLGPAVQPVLKPVGRRRIPHRSPQPCP
jgi:hypothetical protein